MAAVTLDAELRAGLRRLLDAHSRAYVAELVRVGIIDVCPACGHDVDLQTPGCKRCWERHRGRRRRQDPAFRASENARSRERRRRAAEAAAAKAAVSARKNAARRRRYREIPAYREKVLEGNRLSASRRSQGRQAVPA